MDETGVLVVDDDELVLRSLRRMLERQGYRCEVAASALEAREQLASGSFSVVLCDVHMPGESGLELVRHIRNTYSDTATVMISGADDPQIADTALRNGAYGYVIKPFRSNEVQINVINALRRRELEIETRNHRLRLEQMVADRTAELERLIDQLRQAHRDLRRSNEEIIQRLAKAAEFRHDETADHIKRMSLYCDLLARRLGHDDLRCEMIRLASPLHDVGKLGIPDSILLKPGPLTKAETEHVRRHAEIGYRLLSGSGFRLLDLAARIARSHHERFDGQGYPDRLAGEDIPPEARIAAVADVFDALSSHRVYKAAYPIDKCVSIIRQGRGTHFDPDVVDCFLEAIPEVLLIRAENPDRHEIDVAPEEPADSAESPLR